MKQTEIKQAIKNTHIATRLEYAYNRALTTQSRGGQAYSRALFFAIGWRRAGAS